MQRAHETQGLVSAHVSITLLACISVRWGFWRDMRSPWISIKTQDSGQVSSFICMCLIAYSESRMAAPAIREPRRSAQLLTDVGHLYGQYQTFFLPRSKSCTQLGDTLTRLDKAIRHFRRNYDTGKEPRSVFSQLTVGLSDTLYELRHILLSSSPGRVLDLPDANGWSPSLDDASISQFQGCLRPMTTMVEVINEAMEK